MIPIPCPLSYGGNSWLQFRPVFPPTMTCDYEFRTPMGWLFWLFPLRSNCLRYVLRDCGKMDK